MNVNRRWSWTSAALAVVLGPLIMASMTAAVDPAARIATSGLGAIRIGMTVDQVREANGGRIGEISNAAGDGSCASAELSPRVSALFTRGVLARVYVNTRRHPTHKGIRVGDSAGDVRRAYGRKVTSAPAPYDPRGRELRVTTGNRRIVFTTRSTGRIVAISTGRFPEITYIEGCA